MLMDFKILKNRLQDILEPLDHKYLNEINYFKKVNPTSENIAKYIYDRVKGQDSRVEAVTVWESDNCSARYSE